MKSLIIVLFIAYAMAKDSSSPGAKYVTKRHKSYYEKNVYWRTWNYRYLPKDAFIGGYSSQDCGRVAVYLVQGFEPTERGIYPSQVHLTTSRIITCAGGKTHVTHEYIWVLSTKDQNALKWIPYQDIDNLGIDMNEHCVVGGYENNQNTFFGRYHQDAPETTIIGAVFRDSRNQLTFRSHEGKYLNPFQVLCYD